MLTCDAVARDALLQYISTTCCWGSGAAKKADIECEWWASMVCKLDTFVQHRTTAPKQVCYAVAFPSV